MAYPIWDKQCPYNLPKTAPRDIIGENIPLGNGRVKARIIKMNFRIT